MSEKSTRQQIYDRIRMTSKDSYILEEMKRLGFWDSSDVPSLSETLIKRESEVNKELTSLLEKDRKYRNQEALLREMRKERMKKAKEKREETKLRNKKKRLDKAAKWKSMQEHQVIYLGKDVSAGLNNTETNEALLNKNNLPVFKSLTDLGQSMQLELSNLRYLLFQRKVSRQTHYYNFEIPKKSGGKRKISAPKRRMKALQLWVLNNILDRIAIGEQAHGFIKQRSIVTNAGPHTGKDIVINIDLKDFFPSIDYKRVKGLFHKLGYSEQMATIFALICTQAETETVAMDGVTYYVQKGKRILPQGSPASPAISNLIAYKLDKKVKGLADKLGFRYTRYADDLSFSTDKGNEKNIASLLHFVGKIIKSEGLTINPEKTHIMRSGAQQKVTGIVVNEKLNVERKQLHNFRALLHNIETNGWNGQKWGRADNVMHSIEGYIHFIKMVNPEKSIRFGEQLTRIVEKHGLPLVEEKTCTKQDIAPKQVVQVEEPLKPEPTIQPGQKQEDSNKKTSSTDDWWNIFS
ncbi:retron St85 family RNA-directed DNA polymerase [Bacteroides sp. 519]|uniref:retron St85 family RNA-directed DNA polymerase n=1 Tax=Bacteroides sp. 519 TaxID=2302937 RepID=UPI0013D00078|nr:retron St85 family RNA-directed DNA polymerase [Bacteroides sp. 519]NDV58428.1 RNA-directed DNA polymerase [Bacteroides sp. 519]